MSAKYDCVCRLCLSSRGELLPIFPTTTPDDAGIAILASKIKDCVSVQINENDDLPTNVCKKCMDNVNNWHIFKSVCEKAQNKLLSLKTEGQLEEVRVKNEPLSDEIYDDEVVIDGSYPDFEQNASGSNKLQPEGPPILASLGLTPRSDKGIESDKEEEEEEEEEEMVSGSNYPKVPSMPEVSITVMRPSGETLHSKQGIQELASKNCLVCGRAYRYSHNARRHELTSHGFDRYTNKIIPRKSGHMQPKLRPNPFNPKARLMPNPIHHKMQLMPKHMPSKMIPHKVIPKPKPVPKQIPVKSTTHNNLPYPLRIKALKDLQIKKKEPQILKTLLTAKPEVLVSEPEILNSGPESPETLISEPEIASFQVETIISEPDAFEPQPADDYEMDEVEQVHKSKRFNTVDIGSDNEIEIARDQGGEDYEDVPMANEDQEDANAGGEEEDRVDDDDRDDEDYVPEDEEYNNDKEKLSDTENIECDKGDVRSDNENEEIENGIGIDIEENEHEIDADKDNVEGKEQNDNEEEKIDEDGDDVPNETEDYDGDETLLAPVVEINENVQNHSNSNIGAEDAELNDSAELNESSDLNEISDINNTTDINESTVGNESTDINQTAETDSKEGLDPNKVYVTKSQKEFIKRHRDIIEQINTKRCLCCDKEHPRRKAVIQHLQKNGYKVPKHTCYNCVVTFGHIGALLSHMRANVCTDLWKIIYSEKGVTDDMIVEEKKPQFTKVTPCRENNKDIFNARSYGCKLCHAKFQLKQFIMKHVLEAHEDGQSMVQLSCVHCGSRFKERSLWKKHIRNGECTVYISCDMCGEKFMTVREFNDHALAAHAGGLDHANSLDQANDTQSKSVDGRRTDCPLCGMKNNNYPLLVKHMKVVHYEEKPHYCQHCDDKFEQACDLNKHIFIEHTDKILRTPNEEIDMSIVKEETEEYHYSCTECDAIFETVDAWTDHQVAEHNQVAHHCDQCEKKFLRPSELAEHKNTHLRVKFYPCSVCTNSFSTPQKLSDHVQQNHPGVISFSTPDADFYCDICIRSFKSRQAYSNHMRIHSKVPTTNRRPGDKGFAPQIIGKPIKQMIFGGPVVPANPFITYKTNVNVPSAPYSCDICGKGFMHKKNIWKHKKVLHADIVGDRNDSEENTMQASTEDDEFVPEENGIGLSTPQFDSFNFTNYGNGSQDALPFACDLCYKRFPLKSSLWKHKRAKHGTINVAETSGQPAGTIEGGPVAPGGGRSSCTICKITFADKKSYYRHRKNVHKSNVQMCKICGKPLSSTLELYEHLKAAHARELLGYNTSQAAATKSEPAGEPDAEYEPDPGADYQARYPCDACGKQFVGLLALQNHRCLDRASDSPQTYDCEICHKSYTSIAALKSHRGWHLRSPDGKAAANNSGLWMPQHKVTSKVSKHEVPDAPPPRAPSKRRPPPDLEVTVVNPNKKPRSEDSADAQGGLDDRYCTICDKEFTKRAAFQRHVEEVHRPNSVFCPVCDRSFTRKSTLIVHMRKHYGGGGADDDGAEAEDEGLAYACDLCGAQYGSPKALRAHKARHHGEDSAESEEDVPPPPAPPPPGEFTCGQCGDGVATPRDLLAHRTMHATPTKHYCAPCKVYFSRGPELATHTRHRHSDADKTLFPCAMCDRFYMNKKSLQRHIEMAH